MTTELVRVGRRYQRRRRALEMTHAELVPLIRAARREGLTLRRIGELTGLSYARVYQIEKEAERE